MNYKSLIRTIPNFPKPGIRFRDITPLLASGTGFRHVIAVLGERYAHKADEQVEKLFEERFRTAASPVHKAVWDGKAPLDLFSPPVRDWFRASFAEPTAVQERGWHEVAEIA